eukprot:TRINITY_DN2117_c0_g2_i2.p2 TRINITY_DN2117_c0_g2~~TRINITY_DN2117_c0_g2_i2.p2  ORF type:complete len:100 (-),score=4.92 TRINITY_DN2117_c0_g2_i2:288-587(-)
MREGIRNYVGIPVMFAILVRLLFFNMVPGLKIKPEGEKKVQQLLVFFLSSKIRVFQRRRSKKERNSNWQQLHRSFIILAWLFFKVTVPFLPSFYSASYL